MLDQRSRPRTTAPVSTAPFPAIPPRSRQPAAIRVRLFSWAMAVMVVVALVSAGESEAQWKPQPAPMSSTPADATASVWDAPEPWRTDRFYIQTSVATIHFNSDPDHDNTQRLIYGEWRLPYRWLDGQPFIGASGFDNSFGQWSQFYFGGVLWRPIEKAPEFYVKVAAGALHGYTGEFEDKVPFNSNGWSPGIVPGVGYCYKRFCGEMILFGGAGILWTVGMTLP